MKKFIVAIIVFLTLNSSLIILNSDAQWVQVTNATSNVTYIYDFASSGVYLFTLTESNGVFRSSNNGVNWIPVNNGLPLVNNRCITAKGTNIFVGSTTGGVYRSTNNGDNWTAVNSGLTKLNVLSFCVSGTNIFAGTGSLRGSIFRSTNDGTNWNEVFILPTDGSVDHFTTKGTNLYVLASFFLSSQIFVSSNNGINWNAASSPSAVIATLIANDPNLFIGKFNGVSISTNNGANWSSCGLQQFYIYDFAVSGSNLFAGSDTGGVFLSTNNGTNWITKNQGFNNILPVVKLFLFNNYIFAGGLYVWRRSLSEIIGIQNISAEIPSKYSLLQNYPNPFNPSTVVRYQLPVVSFVSIKVYDIMGCEVQTLVNERLKPGTYEATFDGSMLNSGVYFYKLVADGYTETKRMLLVK